MKGGGNPALGKPWWKSRSSPRLKLSPTLVTCSSSSPGLAWAMSTAVHLTMVTSLCTPTPQWRTVPWSRMQGTCDIVLPPQLIFPMATSICLAADLRYREREGRRNQHFLPSTLARVTGHCVQTEFMRAQRLKPG